MLHELLFEKHFLKPGYARALEVLVLENGELVDKVHLPTWTKKTIRERLNRFALNSSLHPKQIERLRTVWIELLQIINVATQYEQQFETVLQPLVDFVLTPKQNISRSMLGKVSGKNKKDFVGFAFTDGEFVDLLDQLKRNFPLILSWITNISKTHDRTEQYYATLWMILAHGKLREQLKQTIQPLCDINLSLPVEAKRLIDLVLNGQLIRFEEKDLNSLKRNLDRALHTKTGRSLRETTTPSMLQIHGDLLLDLLRIELLRYRKALKTRASRMTNGKGPRLRNKQKSRSPKKTASKPVFEMLSLLEAEREKVNEVIDFLTHYTEAPRILVEAGINSESTAIQNIRRHQVMNFNLQELPQIDETWLDKIKSLNDYPNLRAFLLEYQLPISTAGRRLMHLRKASSNSAVNGASKETFRIALQLVQELRTLQNAVYRGEMLNRFVNHIAEKLWRWEISQITVDQLPTLIKEKLLSSSACYGQDVESLLEYVERYDQLFETKILSTSEMNMHSRGIEKQYQELLDSML